MMKDSWYDHYDNTGHSSFIGTEREWRCLVCEAKGKDQPVYCGMCGGNSTSGHDSRCPNHGELTMEQVLGKEQTESYQQAYAYIHALSGDLSKYLCEGDSLRALGLGVKL
jgi:hypothetical protein